MVITLVRNPNKAIEKLQGLLVVTVLIISIAGCGSFGGAATGADPFPCSDQDQDRNCGAATGSDPFTCAKQNREKGCDESSG